MCKRLLSSHLRQTGKIYEAKFRVIAPDFRRHDIRRNDTRQIDT